MESEPRITFISVGWTSADGRQTVISLPEMRKHCRPERVEDLLDDLTVLCEDVLNGQSGASRTNTALRVLR
jgi:hypothetical protein